MLGAIAAGAQTALGIGQMIGGLFMPKPEVPDYEIPQELFENMTDAEYWSYKGLPEAQKQQFIEQSQRAGATALSRNRERKGGLGMISSIAQQEQDAAKDLLSMDTQARMKNLERFWGARQSMAQARDTKFGHDMNKTMYKRERRDNMLGAGMQNIAGALGSAVGLSEAGKLNFGKKKLPAVKSVDPSFWKGMGRDEAVADSMLKQPIEW